MKDKTFKTYSQQLDSLEAKGLVISDRSAALDTIRRVSYFALISGYKVPYRTDARDRYQEGVTFDELVALYEFDNTLSTLFLSSILACERHLKTAYGYHFAQKHGAYPDAYLNPKSYDWGDEDSREGIRGLISLLKGHLRNQDDPHGYIDHYNVNYNKVPIWVLMHSVTFGELAHLYRYAQDDLRNVLCTEFPSMKSRHLPGVLSFLKDVRNNCAHAEPLYTLRAKKRLPVLGLHESLGLVEDGSAERTCRSGQNDPFGALVALRYFLAPKRFGRLVDRTGTLLDDFFSEERWITRSQLLDLMGFPDNWRDVAAAEL